MEASTDMDMVLLGAGCCRFDGWQAIGQGYQTVDECNYRCLVDPTCIAADVARPRGNTFDCYLFYGGGGNFHLACEHLSGQKPECYRKQKATTTTTTTTTMEASTDMDMVLLGAGCCRFDGWQAIGQGYQTVDECNSRCLVDPTCIAADVARPRGNTFDCYLFYGGGENFRLECSQSPSFLSGDECYRKQKTTTTTTTTTMVLLGAGCCRFDG